MHYILAKDVLRIPQPEFANMPDVWPNRTLNNILDGFFWSHGMIDRGGAIVPNAPSYPIPMDGRYPEIAMADFIKKVKTPVTDLDRNMIIGFAAHNAMDRNVHYEYFLGGPGPITDPLNLWQVQHAQKEEWSDYYAYGVMVCGSGMVFDGQFDQFDNIRAVFNPAGLPTTSIRMTIPNTSAWLLRRAQLSMQKNGYNITAGGGNKFEQLNDTHTEIQGMINEFNSTDYDGGLARITDPANPKCIREARWNELRALARDPANNWTIDRLSDRILRSAECARSWCMTIQGLMQ